MGLVAADFFRVLKALLPFGPAWGLDDDSVAVKQFDAWSQEFARIQARADALVVEADPRTTTELLFDYERIFELPDTCVTIDQTIEQRRVALHSKIISSGGQSRAYFIGIAEAMGYPGATIDEYAPMTCNDDCNDALYSDADRFAWTLNLPASTGGVFVMDCNSDCNSALQSWGDEALECRINKFKPAHTSVIFAYL